MAGDQPFVIGVSPSLGVNTLPELIALAKSKPGKILYAAAQRGSMPHLASELLRSRADIDIGFVPYPSTTQAVQDIVGGRISVIFEGMSALEGPIKAGWIKPIAVTSPQRLPNFPDIPTAAETVSGYRASGWFVLMAPAGTPDAIVQKTQSRFAHRSWPTRTSGKARQACYIRAPDVGGGDRSIHHIRAEAVAADCEKTDGLAVSPASTTEDI